MGVNLLLRVTVGFEWDHIGGRVWGFQVTGVAGTRPSPGGTNQKVWVLPLDPGGALDKAQLVSSRLQVSCLRSSLV